MVAPRVFVALLALAVALAVAGCVRADYLIDDRVRLVDSFELASGVRNYLVRGNMPLTFDELCAANQTFDAASLAADIRVAVQKGGLPDVRSFYVLDVSLVNPGLTPCPDAHDFALEQAYAATHNDSLALVNWVLLGDADDPRSVSESVRRTRAITLDSWQHDMLSARVAKLRSLLEQPHASGLPLVVYIHCEQGIDRTGELSGAYELVELGMSVPLVNSLNRAVAGRMPQANNQNALLWLCYHLVYTGVRPELDCAASAPRGSRW